MARKPVFDACMLCGEVPCHCKKPAKKTAPKKAAKPQPVLTLVVDEAPEPAPVAAAPVVTPAPPRPDPRAAMRAQVGRSRTVPTLAPATPPAPQVNKIINYTPQTTGDAVIDDAIRCLGPILHPDEKAKYQDLMWSNNDTCVRAARWRNRHREVLNELAQG